MLKKNYTHHQRRGHKKFNTADSGFVVDDSYPMLGASPDLLVSCECESESCGFGLCEIKCPESIKESTPSPDNWTHLVRVGDDVELAKSSIYYAQVQGQMAILQRKYCDFFVYTAHGFHLERIQFEPDFWKGIKSNLLKFWELYVAPELLTGCIHAKNMQYVNLMIEHGYCKDLLDGDSAGVMLPAQPTTSHAGKGPLGKPRLPKVYLCQSCGIDLPDQPISSSDESVECSSCGLWYHSICCGLSNMDKIDGSQQWLCTKCAR